ncbi:MAG: agmatinase [Rhodospirillales bacterium]|nr:agmatinase [Rhodospirillales bacterium]
MYQNPIRSAFGVPTFGKAPLVSPDEDWKADIAILGAPFDQAVTFRPGARFGPRAIRDAALRYAFFPAGTGYWDMRTETWRITRRVVDCGDTDVVPLDADKCFTNLTHAVRQIRKKGAFPVVLGGDHSITLPILQAFDDAGKITLVHFDAHTDYRDHVGGQRIGHAQVIRRVCELDYITRAVSLGIRAIRTEPGDVRDIVRRGNTIIPAWDIHRMPIAEIVSKLPSGERVYVTFDIDAMDPSIAPGTGTTEVGGLFYEQARALLQAVCERNEIVGFDMVEVNPMIENIQLTGLLAAQLTLDFLGFVFPGKKEATGR